MGFNPFRQRRRSPADYAMVVAALVVCVALVLWAFLGVTPRDPWDDDAVEVRRVQPYQATKEYRCPGCDHEIAVGVGHVVAVPREAPDLRRHWHHPCWRMRHRRPRR